MRVRVGRRGKEQEARITGVATCSSHGCIVGVNATVPSGALPDVWMAFSHDDPSTVLLARKLVEALEARGIDWRRGEKELARTVDETGEYWRLVRDIAAGVIRLESISKRSLERGLCWAYAGDVSGACLGSTPEPFACAAALTEAIDDYQSGRLWPAPGVPEPLTDITGCDV